MKTTQPTLDFDGDTFDPVQDLARLNAQTLRVWSALQTDQWLTLRELETLTGDPQASISARLRDLRKRRFGSHIVLRRRRDDGRRGIHEYKLDRRTHIDDVTPA
jgi:hypothetical protein